MHLYLRNVTALGFLGCVTMGFVLPGCGSRLGPVRATQSAGWTGHANLPDIVLGRSKECMEMYAPQLEPGRVALSSTVEVNEDGDKVGVTIEGIPQSAPDMGACLRNVLHDIPIAEGPFRKAVEALKYRIEHASDGQDALLNFINVIPGVPIVVSELVLEVDAYTVVLPVTVKVVAKRVKQVDLDNATLAKIGQLTLDTVGYDEIMRQAKEQGWVKSVRKIQPKAPAGKGLIAQSETEVVVVMYEVFTEYAVMAGVVSQLDSPLPGPADLAAIGIMAVGLYKVGALALNALGTPTAAAPATTPQVPPPPPPPPRKYPNQTCEEVDRIRLEAAKDVVCPISPQTFPGENCRPTRANAKLLPLYPCSLIKARIAAVTACVAARQKVQDECFKKGDPQGGHIKQIDDLTKSITWCGALKVVNCAPSHPMAGL